MQWKSLFLVFLTLALLSCSKEDPSHSPTPSFKTLEISGRPEKDIQTIPLVYRVKIPAYWIVKYPISEGSTKDTTQALIEFFIEEENATIRIALHNFPSNSLSQRIPSMAQINRWKGQFHNLSQTSATITPQAFGGYYGFLLEATGQIQGIPTSIIGLAMQIAPEHYRALSHPIRETALHRQMRSDITIKATGPVSLMRKHREAILLFARSFQLIDDIP